MKFRIIFDRDENEITVITEDGGVACIRETENLCSDTPRIAVTDYYQKRLTDITLTRQSDLFECLAEGKMYHNDWVAAKYNDLIVINDALNWLCPGEITWVLCDDLFLQFFGDTQTAKTNIKTKEYLEQINDADAFDLLEMILKTPSIIQNSEILTAIKVRDKKNCTGQDEDEIEIEIEKPEFYKCCFCTKFEKKEKIEKHEKECNSNPLKKRCDSCKHYDYHFDYGLYFTEKCNKGVDQDKLISVNRGEEICLLWSEK